MALKGKRKVLIAIFTIAVHSERPHGLGRKSESQVFDGRIPREEWNHEGRRLALALLFLHIESDGDDHHGDTRLRPSVVHPVHRGQQVYSTHPQPHSYMIRVDSQLIVLLLTVLEGLNTESY